MTINEAIVEFEKYSDNNPDKTITLTNDVLFALLRVCRAVISEKLAACDCNIDYDFHDYDSLTCTLALAERELISAINSQVKL